jgi:hypothetical protein
MEEDSPGFAENSVCSENGTSQVMVQRVKWSPPPKTESDIHRGDSGVVT